LHNSNRYRIGEGLWTSARTVAIAMRRSVPP
jgi:hypothetical protein